MISLNTLIEAFDNNLLFAWELLHAEILLDAYPVNTENLKNLITIYSKGLQKFNSIHLPNENYFKLKINQVMSHKKVLNCLHCDQNIQKTAKKMERKIQAEQLKRKVSLKQKRNYDMQMQLKKQEFDLRITYDVEETKKTKISQMIQQQKIKTQRVKDLLKNCLEKEEDKLQAKIFNRQAKASASAKFRNSLKLEESCISTFGDGFQEQKQDQVVLKELTLNNDINVDI